MDILEIERSMKANNLSLGEVTRAAGVHRDFIGRVRRGEFKMSRTTFMKMRLAISRLRRKDVAPDGALPAACYRLAVAFVAREAKVLPSFILGSDPARRATADPVWNRAAGYRRLALYIANIYLGVPQADLARAAGMSKAGVSYALNDIEDERELAEVGAILAAVEGAFE